MEGETYIGRYRVLSEIGQGGMAVVYKAFDPNLERPVALKVLKVPPSTDSEAFNRLQQRFTLEARVAANLNHPNIVVIHDFGSEAETRRLYIAMELLEGDTVYDLVKKKGKIAPDGALFLVRQIAEAMGHAHKQGIIHRDLKPSNVMVLDGQKVKVLDFGIAKVAELQVSLSGEFLGSPSFSSPEQLSGQPLDARSDLFSIGSLLYYMLAGKRPYKSEKLNDLVLEIVYGEPAPLAQTAPHVPQKIVSIVTRLMAKEPAERFHSAGEVEAAVRQAYDGFSKDTTPDAPAASGEIPVVQRTFRMRAITRRKPKLVFLTGPFEGREIFLDKEKVLLGRHHCDIAIPDREISGNHCVLEVKEEVFIVRDMQSRNGTWVKGRRIEEIEIAPGETFRIGQTDVRVLLEPEPALHPDVPEAMPEEVGSAAVADGDLPVIPSVVDPEEFGEIPASDILPGEPGEDSPTTIADVDVRRIARLEKQKTVPRTMCYKLEILDGPEKGKIIELAELRNVIGRQDCQVCIRDNRVSRKHAEVEVRGINTVYLRDLASTNGTFLNEGEISAVQLKSGDTIKVGNTSMRFTMHLKSDKGSAQGPPEA